MGFRARSELPAKDRAHLDEIAAGVDRVIAEAGYRHVPLPAIHPADLYLDMAGEEIRDRIFLVTDPAGNELCLRADLTIPLCRHALDAHIPWPARVFSSGAVFRYEPQGRALPAETLQASAENLGASDPGAADAEIFALARRAISVGVSRPLIVEVGDLSLFPALVADLHLDEAWARRLLYAYRHPSLLPAVVAEIREKRAMHVPREVAGMSRDEIERFVAAKCGGVETVAGRSVREIADRLMDKVRLAGSSPPSAEDLARIEAFLTVECPASEAPARLAQISRGGNKLAGTTRALTARLSAIHAALNAGDEIRFSAVLGRAFLYYTGAVFEMRAPALALPLAAGGRYDRLLSDLGAAQSVAAVGCAVWPERLLAAGAAP